MTNNTTNNNNDNNGTTATIIANDMIAGVVDLGRRYLSNATCLTRPRLF